MEKLPLDMKVKLLMQLPLQEILSVCSASKELNKVCTEQKYNNLWKQKIYQHFGTKYAGNSAYNQYIFLNKVHKMTFYNVLIDWDTDDPSTHGPFLSFQEAKDFIIDQYLILMRDIGEPKTYEYTLYQFNGSVLTGDPTYSIEESAFEDRNTRNYRKEEESVQNVRETLYVSLFGESSEGASYQMINTRDVQEVRKKMRKGEKMPTLSKAETFFRILYLLIHNYLGEPIDEL